MDIIDAMARLSNGYIFFQRKFDMAENRAYPDQYLLRMPEGMRDMLKTSAERNARSLNAEIVARLEHSLDCEGESSIGMELAKFKEIAAREVAVNSALKQNFEVLAHQLAGPVGENREDVLRVLSALRILGTKVPE